MFLHARIVCQPQKNNLFYARLVKTYTFWRQGKNKGLKFSSTGKSIDCLKQNIDYTTKDKAQKSFKNLWHMECKYW